MAKILIVDDDKYVVEIVKFSLETNGYEVISAFNGEEAIAKIMHEIPNLVLLDLKMPKMDGWETYRFFKDYSKTTQVPIVIISAIEDKIGITENMEVEDYMIKPFEVNELINRVKNILKV